MAQTAAHLADHVIPPVPVRQWVISVPKRLRGFLAERPQAVAVLTRIVLVEIERLLCA
jgi:DNA polymerase III psi subunit